MCKPDFARLRQLCRLGVPASWLASLLFPELRRALPCEAMTLLWREPGASAARLLHESATALDCEILDVNVLGHRGGPALCAALGAEDSMLQRLIRVSPSMRAFAERESETLMLAMTKSDLPVGALFLHRASGQTFDSVEKAALLQLAPMLSAALEVVVEPLQLITSKAHTGILLLDHDLTIHSACLQARKLLQLARALPGRGRQGGAGAGDELMQRLRLGISTADHTRAVNFIFRNCWGSFEFFLHRFGRLESDSEQLTAVAVHRQEPLVLSVYRGCTELDLTAKQTDIALLLIQGCSNDVVAAKLQIGSTTVADHVRKIYRKVGAGNRSELVTALALGARKTSDAWPLGCEARSAARHAMGALQAAPRK